VIKLGLIVLAMIEKIEFCLWKFFRTFSSDKKIEVSLMKQAGRDEKLELKVLRKLK